MLQIWPLTPKLDTATRPFLKIDMRHRACLPEQIVTCSVANFLQGEIMDPIYF